MKISIIIPIRFEDRIKRTPKRLFSCLRSLDRGYQKDNSFEVIVSDLDSQEKYIPEIKSICSQFSHCKLIMNKNNSYWNRAQALNYGIRASSESCEYIGCTDMDMIFLPNFLAVVKKRCGPKVLLQCHCKFVLNYLGDDVFPSMTPEFEKLCTLSKDYSAGGFQCARRSRFIECPYDEQFRVWGGEDTLWRDLAIRNEFKIDWIDDATSIYHLKHKHYLDVVTPEEERFRVRNETLWVTKLWLHDKDRAGFKEIKV